MSVTMWVRPGGGASLGLIKTLLHGVGSTAPEDWKRKTGLLVELYRFEEHGLDEKDRLRLFEVLKRAQEGLEL